MKKHLIIFMIIIFISLFPYKSYADEIPIISGEGAVVMDLNSSEIIYQKNMNTPYAPASTTKIMTALLTLEKCNLEDKVIVGKKPPFEDGSKIYLFEGEEITVKDLLYALLLNSANDAALALAEHISGSKEAFALLMNQRAKDLGCKNTNFVNPNGLYEENHYTTAYDLSLITKEALKNKIFNEIIKTQSYVIQPTNKQSEKRYLHNQNRLIFNPRYKYSGADGVKTGYTTKSKHTFVGSATQGDRRIVVVILYSKEKVWTDVKKLMDYGFKNYENVKLISKDEVLTNLSISNENVPVISSEDLYITIPTGKKPVVNKQLTLNQNFTSIKKGSIVGYINITINNEKNFKVPLLAAKDVNSPENLFTKSSTITKNILTRNKWKFAALVVLFLFLVRGLLRKYKRYYKILDR